MTKGQKCMLKPEGIIVNTRSCLFLRSAKGEYFFYLSNSNWLCMLHDMCKNFKLSH